MAVFYSYVKLPEGTPKSIFNKIERYPVWGLAPLWISVQIVNHIMNNYEHMDHFPGYTIQLESKCQIKESPFQLGRSANMSISWCFLVIAMMIHLFWESRGTTFSTTPFSSM